MLALTAVDMVSHIPDEFKDKAYSEILRHLLTRYLSYCGKTSMEYQTENESTQESLPVTQQSQEEHGEISLIDFIDMLKITPKTNSEWITVFAYYKKHYLLDKEFTLKELPDYFKLAGLKIPANLYRDTKKALSKHLIAQSMKTKDVKIARYYITRKGEELVRGMLSGEK